MSVEEAAAAFVEGTLGTPIFRLLLQFLDADTLAALSQCRPVLQSEIRVADQAWEGLLRLTFGGDSTSARRLCPDAASPREAFVALAGLRRALRSVEVVHGDLRNAASLGVEAAVVPTVPSLEPYGPAARAVHEAAGPELGEYIFANLERPLQVGGAFWTPGFGLGTQGIVHAVGPTVRTPNGDRKLHEVYAAALQKVVENGHRSVAIASISTGGNGMESRLASLVAVEEIRAALARLRHGRDLRVVILAFEDEVEVDFRDAIDKMCWRVNEDVLEMLPLIVLDPMVPRQRLRFDARCLLFALPPDCERFAMVGRGRRSSVTTSGVEVRLLERSSSGGTTQLEVLAGRRFSLPGGLSFQQEPDDTGRPYCNVSVEWVREEREPCSGDGERPWLDTSRELGPMVERWLLLVRAGHERQPGQMDMILEQLGPMPAAESPADRALWVAALINPLPALGVAMEIRDLVLLAHPDGEKIAIVREALEVSIDHLAAKTPIARLT